METEFFSQNENETAAIAVKLATEIESKSLICLYGDLGAGKSVFARAFIQSLMPCDTDVPSPTFTLLQTYESKKTTLYHYDLYRLEYPKEVYELDWENALYDGITIVEWPSKLGDLLPDRRIDVTLEPINHTTRKIIIHDRT